MNLSIFLLIAFIPMLMATLGTGLALKLLRYCKVFDHPNHRSSHTSLIPRGGGIPVIIILLAAWIALFFSENGFEQNLSFWVIVGGILALASISWLDDLKGGLSAIPRIFIQILAVSAGVLAFPEDGMVFQGIFPLWLDRIISALTWLWFINLFNFMDGIDGISGVKVFTIGIGIFLLGLTSEIISHLALPGLALASVALGFLFWNWSPAKIFLGDVGSIPLGFLTAWLLLNIALIGHWEAALLLPAYYLADSSITLLKRILRGEKPWHAHKEHAYQFAVSHGDSHSKISLLTGVLGVLLIGITLLAIEGGIFRWIGLGVGCFIVVIFLCYLQRKSILKVNNN